MPQFFFVVEGAMLRRRLFRWEAVGFLFVCALGTLLHFVYEWSGGNGVVGAFSAVNESTWEHMKLLFFPMLLFSAVQFAAAGQNYPNFLAVRAVSILTGTLLIPVLFYTYTGVLGHGVTWVNIAIFYAAALAAFLLDSCLLRQGALFGPWKQLLGLAVLWLVAFLFIWCTWQPVELPLWQDPVTGGYGISL